MARGRRRCCHRFCPRTRSCDGSTSWRVLRAAVLAGMALHRQRGTGSEHAKARRGGLVEEPKMHSAPKPKVSKVPTLQPAPWYCSDQEERSNSYALSYFSYWHRPHGLASWHHLYCALQPGLVLIPHVRLVQRSRIKTRPCLSLDPRPQHIPAASPAMPKDGTFAKTPVATQPHLPYR